MSRKIDERTKKAIENTTVFWKEKDNIWEITQDAAGSMCVAAISCFNYGYICGMREERRRKKKAAGRVPIEPAARA